MPPQEKPSRQHFDVFLLFLLHFADTFTYLVSQMNAQRRRSIMQVLIFQLGRHAPSQMPLRLVVLQNLLHLLGYHIIQQRQALSHVLVYRAFAHPKHARRLTHRTFALDYVIAYLQNPFSDIFLHVKPPKH
jgi:hypothetical protein